MKVLVVGSLHHVEHAEVFRAQFSEACQQLGASLARSGFEFIIDSTTSDTAERYVLEGAAKVEGIHKVWVFRPEHGDAPELPATGGQRGQLKIVFRRLRGPWGASRVPQILAADCVLLVGGAQRAAHTIYEALALEKPVVAIGAFGGSGKDLWPQFAPFYEGVSSLRDRIGALREAWQNSNADLAVTALKVLVRRRAFQRMRVGPSVLLFLLNLVLFAAWIALFVAPFSPVQAAFFTLLAVSAFLGTALRSSLRIVSDAVERPTRDALVAELSAGLVLAFVLALLYLAGSFTFTGRFDVVSATSPLSDYQRIAVSMGLIGIAGGWLLERVAESLTSWYSQRLPKRAMGEGP